MSYPRNHEGVGRAFAAGRAFRNGNWRTELREGVCIGVSYSTPVCAMSTQPGETGIVLRTIHSYSVTTQGKHLRTIYRAGGEWLPATEETLERLRYGRMSFADAVKAGRELLAAAADRLRSEPVRMSREGDFTGGSIRRTADGKRWIIFTPEGASASTYRTRREAGIAAREHFAPAPTWHDVTHADARAAVTA